MAHFYCKEVEAGVPLYYCYLRVGGKSILPNQEGKVYYGDTVEACYSVIVDGGETVGVQVWDYTDNKALSWKTYTKTTFDCVKFKVNLPSLPSIKKKIGLILYKFDSGKWVQVDSYGPFYLIIEPPPIIPKPNIELVDIWLSSNTVYVGDTVTIYIKLHNAGNAKGEAEVSLSIDGFEKTLTTEVDAFSDKIISYNYTPTKAGNYNVIVCLGKTCKATQLIVYSKPSQPSPPSPPSQPPSQPTTPQLPKQIGQISMEYIALAVGVGAIAVIGFLEWERTRMMEMLFSER